MNNRNVRGLVYSFVLAIDRCIYKKTNVSVKNKLNYSSNANNSQRTIHNDNTIAIISKTSQRKLLKLILSNEKKWDPIRVKKSFIGIFRAIVVGRI